MGGGGGRQTIRSWSEFVQHGQERWEGGDRQTGKRGGGSIVSFIITEEETFCSRLASTSCCQMSQSSFSGTIPRPVPRQKEAQAQSGAITHQQAPARYMDVCLSGRRYTSTTTSKLPAICAGNGSRRDSRQSLDQLVSVTTPQAVPPTQSRHSTSA